jgi:hypothetical protein
VEIGLRIIYQPAQWQLSHVIIQDDPYKILIILREEGRQ